MPIKASNSCSWLTETWNMMGSSAVVAHPLQNLMFFLYIVLFYFIGVTVKFWNIYLKDDGLEENHERLEVVLKAQKNVVLGARSKASVDIVDPRHGKVSNA